MSTQLLIYETAVPVSPARHRKCSVEVKDYGFARNVNAVPIVAAEFPFAAAEYTIVFAGNADDVMPAVILGVRDKENLYLTDKGDWRAKYIPAFIRRYPFVFSVGGEPKTYTLCVDESYQGLNYMGHGKPMFTSEGKPSPFLESVLSFQQQYGALTERTKAFCKKLHDLKLLEPMKAQFTFGSGEKTSLGGFMAVDRNKLKALDGETMSELAKTDELELLYLHLNSMRNFTTLKDHLVQSSSNGVAKAAPVESTEANEELDEEAEVAPVPAGVY